MDIDQKIDKLVHEFADVSRRSVYELLEGDSRLVRKLTNRIGVLWKRIRGYGDRGRESLSGMLTHPDPSVRLATATFLLRYKHEESMAVLHELSLNDSFVGWCAFNCIERWEEGAWQLDPPDDDAGGGTSGP